MVTFAGRIFHYQGMYHKPHRLVRGDSYNYGFPGYVLLLDADTGDLVKARADLVMLVYGDGIPF